MQMPQPPGDRGDRRRVGLRRVAIKQPIALAKRPRCQGLIATSDDQAPGAGLPQVLLVAQPLQPRLRESAGAIELIQEQAQPVSPQFLHGLPPRLDLTFRRVMVDRPPDALHACRTLLIRRSGTDWILVLHSQDIDERVDVTFGRTDRSYNALIARSLEFVQ